MNQLGPFEGELFRVQNYSYLSPSKKVVFEDLDQEISFLFQRIQSESDLPQGELSHMKALKRQAKKLEAEKNQAIFGYELAESSFAEGAFGSIWKATHPSWPQENFAFKFSFHNQEKIAHQEIAILEFLAEQDWEGCEKHISPLIAYFDLFDKSSAPHKALLFPLYTGDLSLLLATGSEICEQQVLGYFCDGLESLVFLKRHGILHLDIKLDNFFLTENGSLRLGDFGLSLKKSDPKLTSLRGTPMYIAPELFADFSFCDHYTDLWALAVTMYFLYLGTCGIFQFPNPTATLSDSELKPVFQRLQKMFQRFFPEEVKEKAKSNGKGGVFDSPRDPSCSKTFKQHLEDKARKIFYSEPDKLEVLSKLFYRAFDLDPSKRISAEEALEMIRGT